jgi:hypothetical protein
LAPLFAHLKQNAMVRSTLGDKRSKFDFGLTNRQTREACHGYKQSHDEAKHFDRNYRCFHILFSLSNQDPAAATPPSNVADYPAPQRRQQCSDTPFGIVQKCLAKLMTTQLVIRFCALGQRFFLYS